MIDALRRLRTNEEGQDLIEYALIAFFISALCYVAVIAFGLAVSDLWTYVQTQVETAISLM
jgi:Flp pilus assembly pilin Flp